MELEKIKYVNKRGGVWSMDLDSEEDRLYTGGHDRFIYDWDFNVYYLHFNNYRH